MAEADEEGAGFAGGFVLAVAEEFGGDGGLTVGLLYDAGYSAHNFGFFCG